MKLEDALEPIKVLAFDTAPIIYFLERHPSYFDRVKLILEKVADGAIKGVGSTLLLAEVLVLPISNGKNDLAKIYEAKLTRSPNFQVEPVSVSIARLAAELRSKHNLKTPDALHIATALDSGCDAFLTNDRALKRVSELTILVLDDLELDEVE